MKSYIIDNKEAFFGRDFERRKLLGIGNASEPAIIVVHGRRRVGKTALSERAFGERGLLKFEGRESQLLLATRSLC